MCNCASCKATDYPLDRPFADWPKGDRPPLSVYGRAKIPKDKAYTAHWAHCGAEAHTTRAKLNMKMHIPQCAGHFLTRAHGTDVFFHASPAPATTRLPHTQLNRDGWRERMIALNAAAIGKGE